MKSRNVNFDKSTLQIRSVYKEYQIEMSHRLELDTKLEVSFSCHQ